MNVKVSIYQAEIGVKVNVKVSRINKFLRAVVEVLGKTSVPIS
jgi:hypothetical protein